jgi:hypothetical protein
MVYTVNTYSGAEVKPEESVEANGIYYMEVSVNQP